MISETVRSQLSFLQFFAETQSKKQRTLLLKSLSTKQFKAITEVLVNLMAGNIPVSTGEKAKISSHKTTLLYLTDLGVPKSLRLKRLMRKTHAAVMALKLALSKLTLFGNK